jgi:hypothetical protein
MTAEELRDAMRWTPQERAAFVARFPRLLRRPDGSERTYFTVVGHGWIPLLARVFVIAEADERATIASVFQKYGALRIELEHLSVDPELLRVIDEVEDESESICEACGERCCTTHLLTDADRLDDRHSQPSPPTP